MGKRIQQRSQGKNAFRHRQRVLPGSGDDTPTNSVEQVLEQAAQTRRDTQLFGKPPSGKPKPGELARAPDKYELARRLVRRQIGEQQPW